MTAFTAAAAAQAVRGTLLSGHPWDAVGLARNLSESGRTWLPETLTLCGARGLISNPAALQDILSLVPGYSGQLGADSNADLALAGCHGRIGRIGFSFPIQRFLARGFAGGPCILERWGMWRLDIADPQEVGWSWSRKDAGTGHGVAGISDVAEQDVVRGDVLGDVLGDVVIEYRRSMVSCAHPAMGTLVIRNNSHFYGRDLLPEPAYFSRTGNADTSHMFKGDTLHPWAGGDRSEGDLAGDVLRVGWLLDRLDIFDASLSEWLFQPNGAGHRHLLPLLGQLNDTAWLATIDAHDPPWFPSNPVRADEAVRNLQAKTGRHTDALHPGTGSKTVLLSGQDGDMPA